MVGVTALKGYFKFLLDADAANGNRHFEENTYSVVVVEPHAVDGVADSSLHTQGRGLMPLRASSVEYHGYFGKLGKRLFPISPLTAS